ncbi:MAG TPA: J domain-containing protein [Spirochaetota bacterium]|nr:J domain-containing protein [Spirochaetota bacterium]HPI89212.1 J domain-containing protein [Spirochaetota bacterium]HPR48971.1 J domain-containing protein [Spirochaetota bacterium]
MSKKVYYSTNTNLINAYSLLFTGSNFSSMEQIYKLNITSLKSAYRDKIKNNHPDRARHLGISEHILSERFKQITHAYDELRHFIYTCEGANIASIRNNHSGDNKKHTWFYHKESADGTAYHSANEKEKQSETGESSKNQSDRSQQHMPKNELPFGQFLLFSGVISLQVLIKAIIWQREQRPTFGSIAREWNLLSLNEIALIFKNRRRNEKFGECALRLGYLNTFQKNAILTRQKNAQKPLGRYFVENNLISPLELELHLVNQKKHNLMAKKNFNHKKQ